MESLGSWLGGQAPRIMHNYIEKWDFNNEDNNPYFKLAITREASRVKCRLLQGQGSTRLAARASSYGGQVVKTEIGIEV